LQKDDVGIGVATQETETLAIRRPVKREDLLRIKFGDLAAGRTVNWLNPAVVHTILAYSGSLMTQITDEKGRVLLRNSYEHGSLTNQDFGKDETYPYSYEWNDSRRYVQSVEISFPNGGRQEVQTGNSVPDAVRYTNH
jgi:hypothetical protein